MRNNRDGDNWFSQDLTQGEYHTSKIFYKTGQTYVGTVTWQVVLPARHV